MSNYLKFLIAFGIATLLAVGMAFATEGPGPIDGQIYWGWGDQLAEVITDQLGWVATALVGAMIHWAPGGTKQLIYMFRIDQLLEKAVGAAINKTAGAVRGKALTASVGNEVLERALEYVIFHAPKLYRSNTVQMWRDKIIARLTLAEEVAADPIVAGYLAPSGRF